MPSTRFELKEMNCENEKIQFSFSRVRLTSQGHDMTDDEDDSTDENFTESASLIRDHYNNLAARENMQEFPGRVPQRKRKKDSEILHEDDGSSKPKVRRFSCLTFDSTGVNKERREKNQNCPLSRKKTPKMKGTRCEERKKNQLSHFSPHRLIIYFVIIIIGIEKTVRNDLVVPVNLTCFGTH
jgi:hypothetical protein